MSDEMLKLLADRERLEAKVLKIRGDLVLARGSLIETRDAAAALFNAIHDAGHPELVEAIPEKLRGFGRRANLIIEATAGSCCEDKS